MNKKHEKNGIRRTKVRKNKKLRNTLRSCRSSSPCRMTLMRESNGEILPPEEMFSKWQKSGPTTPVSKGNQRPSFPADNAAINMATLKTIVYPTEPRVDQQSHHQKWRVSRGANNSQRALRSKKFNLDPDLNPGSKFSISTDNFNHNRKFSPGVFICGFLRVCRTGPDQKIFNLRSIKIFNPDAVIGFCQPLGHLGNRSSSKRAICVSNAAIWGMLLTYP